MFFPLLVQEISLSHGVHLPDIYPVVYVLFEFSAFFLGERQRLVGGCLPFSLKGDAPLQAGLGLLCFSWGYIILITRTAAPHIP